MAIPLNDNILSESPKFLDSKIGPYNNTAEALAYLSPARRQIGSLVVIITAGQASMWWFKNGINDADLVPFSGGSSSSIEQYANVAAFPVTGNTSTIYIALDTSLSYYWDGTDYQPASSNVEQYANFAAFPSVGDSEIIYIATDTGISYFWNGTIYQSSEVDLSNLVTLDTPQHITGIKSFQNESLTLFGINGGGPHIVSVRADDGGGTIIFEEVGAGGDAVVAYRSWVTSQLGSALPSQTGNNGKWLQTDGTAASWQTLDTSVVSENTNLYFTNARAIGATLTGYTSGAGTISSADSILQAIQKLNGNIAGLVTG
ncbi:hypothetical protein KBD45_08435, partial [Candidatus Dojkabacteria bacterium]|nr:hypothetical protein [Candidatus Dojkabacteria bacterium]